MIYKVKLALLGQFGVGKSSILNTLQNKKEYCIQSTLGVDFILQNFTVENTIYKIHIWDTAGQERFRAIVKSYFRDLDVAVLVFDCTDIYGLESLTKWEDDLNFINQKKNCIKFLVANKIDSKHRILTTEQGKVKAKEYGFHYFETSSLDKNTIDNLFQYIIEKIDESRKNEKIELEKHYDNYHIFPKRDNLGKRPKNRCCQIL
jgi:small GTP-binding protein